MRATKSYLRLIFILFIDILIYLKVFKNKLISMKLNIEKDAAEKTNGKYWKLNFCIS